MKTIEGKQQIKKINFKLPFSSDRTVPCRMSGEVTIKASDFRCRSTCPFHSNFLALNVSAIQIKNGFFAHSGTFKFNEGVSVKCSREPYTSDGTVGGEQIFYVTSVCVTPKSAYINEVFCKKITRPLGKCYSDINFPKKLKLLK